MKSRTIEPMSCALCGRLTTLVGLRCVADDGEHGNAVAPRLEQAHRRVQQPDRAVHQRHHRLAGRFGVAVRDRGAGFFVEDGEDLRFAVAAVVDDRLVQAFERRARIDGDVIEVERLQHVDHVIGAGMLNELRADARLGRHEVGAAVGFGGARDAGACGGASPAARRPVPETMRAGGPGGAGRGAFQKVATIDGARRGVYRLVWPRYPPSSDGPLATCPIEGDDTATYAARGVGPAGAADGGD